MAPTVRRLGSTRRDRGWKDILSTKRKKEKTKLAFAVLGLILILVFSSQLVRLVQTLTSPWKSPSSERLHRWEEGFNLNLIIRSKGISLVTYIPKEQKVIVIKMPDETNLDVPFGFGKWQLRAIYGLGQEENGKRGADLLKRSLGDFFGLPIDGYLEFGAPYAQMDASELIDIVRGNPFSSLSIFFALKTDLTPLELLRFRMGVGGVRFDKITELDLKEGVLDKQFLADGSEVYTVDPIKLDGALSDLSDPNFVSEGKKIAVFNATDHPALAQKASRLITNLGGQVIIVDSSEKRLAETVLIGEPSATLRKLQQIFDAFDTIEPRSEDFESSRAQINIFLGEDFIK